MISTFNKKQISVFRGAASEVRPRNGFTIIETLVAITILMIAIAGPLTVASKGFTAALDARNQMIAYNLAQEGLEELNNIKDNGTWPPGDVTCVGANQCGVQVNNLGLPSIVLCSVANNNCALTLSANLGYTYDSGGSKTPFTRYYYLTATGNPPGDQYLATVVVIWNTGSVSNQVQLQELLTSATR